jgi:ATP/maltotriose-dependent transcriptional regulator MalT
MSIILNHKVLPSGLPRANIARDRLDEQFARLLDSHERIGIFAAAGSDKTVQAQLFAARYAWPLAWVSLDAADRCATRLLVYLAAALAETSPNAREMASGWLEAHFSVDAALAIVARWRIRFWYSSRLRPSGRRAALPAAPPSAGTTG